ncbi:MAG: phosphoribosyltransferase [Clostridium sp.]|nr:phosphoribosyltransferase [Clostridium sp.]
MAKYVPSRDFGKVSKIKSNFVKCVWKYMDGDKRAGKKISELYLRYVEEFIKYKGIEGDILLTCIPRSNINKRNPLDSTVLYICTYINTNVKIHNGLNYLYRRKSIKPIHNGNKYTVEDIKISLATRGNTTIPTVIVLDDVVNSGNTFKAAKEVLMSSGAKEVYNLCLFIK